MAPIRGSTRRTRARLDRQAALRNEFEETFGISADGHDLLQFIDHHDDSDDDNFNEEDDNVIDTSALMMMVQQNTVRLAAAAPEPVSVDANQTTQRPFAQLHTQYKHSTDGKYRHVPSSWQFPKISLQAMYQYWHYGDAANNIPPAKYLQKSDVEYLGKAANIRLFCELKKMMTAIDNEATAKGHPSFQTNGSETGSKLLLSL
jgi:hypothetical protein